MSPWTRTRSRCCRQAGVLSPTGAPLELPPKRVIGRSCCRAAYLRGALLGSGSLSGPRDPHLELRAGTLAGAQLLADVAAREDVPLKVAARRNHAVAYVKRHEAILDLLALTGAGETALRLEEDAVVAATRAEANRLANADEANLLRTAHAAHRQLEAIRAVGAENSRLRSPRWPSCVCAIRRRRCASWPGRRARRSRRRRSSAGSQAIVGQADGKDVGPGHIEFSFVSDTAFKDLRERLAELTDLSRTQGPPWRGISRY